MNTRISSLNKFILLMAVLLTACSQPAISIPASPLPATIPPTSLPTATPIPGTTSTPKSTSTSVPTIIPTPTPILEPTLAPFDATAPISSGWWTWQPQGLWIAWQPQGAWLAYTTVDGAVWLRDPTKTTSIPVTGIHYGPYGRLQVKWSPDGSRLLVAGGWTDENSNENAGLWIVAVSTDGPGQAQVIQQPALSAASIWADWSPDGQKIAYNWQEEAWIYDLTSEQTTQVTRLQENPLSGTVTNEPFDRVELVNWFPRGDALILELSGNFPNPFGSPALLDLKDNQLRLLAPSRGGLQPNSSPVGQRFSFLIHGGDTDRTYTYDYCEVNLETGQLTNITLSNPAYDVCNQPPDGMVKYPPPYQVRGPLAWSTAGQYLYATSTYLSDQSNPARGFLIRSGSGNLIVKHLGTGEQGYIYPVWLNDGHYAYIEASPGYSDDWGGFKMIKAFIGEEVVMQTSLAISGASWSPDGKYLALVLDLRANPGQEQLVIQPLRK